MVTEKAFKSKWKKMSEKEKLDWNGFDGFKKGQRRKNTVRINKPEKQQENTKKGCC